MDDADFYRMRMRLHSSFDVSHIMAPRSKILFVAKEEEQKAINLANEFRFSAIPTSSDGAMWFDGVWETSDLTAQTLTPKWRELKIDDFISEDTAKLFASRKGRVIRGIDLIQKARGIDSDLDSGLRLDVHENAFL